MMVRCCKVTKFSEHDTAALHWTIKGKKDTRMECFFSLNTIIVFLLADFLCPLVNCSHFNGYHVHIKSDLSMFLLPHLNIFAIFLVVYFLIP